MWGTHFGDRGLAWPGEVSLRGGCWRGGRDSVSSGVGCPRPRLAGLTPPLRPASELAHN